jgi:hypothetical protein
MYLKLLKRLQQNLRTHTHTHTNICFMRCTIFSSHFVVGEGGWVGITLKCEYKKGGMQRAVSFQAHISKSFSPWNVWWVCIIYTLCFTSLVSQHFTSFRAEFSLLWPIHTLFNILFYKRFCIYNGDYGGGRDGGVFALSKNVLSFLLMKFSKINYTIIIYTLCIICLTLINIYL